MDLRSLETALNYELCIWFGCEDKEHTALIFRKYAEFLQFEEPGVVLEANWTCGQFTISTRNRCRRSPVLFIGCIKRFYCNCDGLINGGIFKTMDVLHIYQRDFAAFGQEMQFRESILMETNWLVDEGIPVDFKVISRIEHAKVEFTDLIPLEFSNWNLLVCVPYGQDKMIFNCFSTESCLSVFLGDSTYSSCIQDSILRLRTISAMRIIQTDNLFI
jgi:hypothetical protein